MNVLRPSDATARVVAWHNRHPLARRITRDQVQGLGVVALPFALRVADDGTPGDDGPLTPIFGTDWMYRAEAAALGDWVRRHGRYPLPECAGWPHRQVDADLPQAHAADAAGLEGRTLRHVLSAVIEADGQRVRVLIAPQAPLARAAVFGRRLPSLRRAAVLAGPLVAGALGTAATLMLWPRAPATLPAAGPVLAAAPAASAASAASPAPVAAGASAASAATAGPAPARPASATVVATAPPVPAASAASMPVAAASQAASGTVAHASPPAATARPTDVAPVVRLRAEGAPPLVQIRPRLTEDEQREARVAAAALRPAAIPSAAGHRTVFAIATPALRTRDDALAQQALLQGLRAQASTPVPTQLSVMPAQGRWRVVWFPHPEQREAEALVVQARARGLKVELIAF